MRTATFVTLLLLPAVAAAADTVVVCPPAFRQALGPWLAHRQQQGHSFVFTSAEGAPEQVRDRIRAVARQNELRYVLLVGDADAAEGPMAGPHLPTCKARAKVIRVLGHDEDIATDNPYADLDGDALPDLAIGRLSVETPQQLTTVVNKILAYERGGGPGGWRRQINFAAGVGGFGALADAALEYCAKKFITEGVPAAYATNMAQASWRSPYCPDPRRFRQTTLDRLNEGSLFWVYIGHGQRRHLDWVRLPGNQYHPIFSTADIPQLCCEHGPPIALFLACYTAAFDERQDCLAEELLRRQGGPVAVVGGSRTTMPYAMAVLATEMMRTCFRERRETLGEVMLHAKRQSVQGKRDDEQSKALDLLAGTLNINGDLAAERAEHVLLFNLIGDPLLRIALPAQAEVRVADSAAVGDVLQVSGTAPIDGPATVELVVRRDRLAFRPPLRRQFEPTDEALAAYQDIYHRANVPRIAAEQVTVRNGQFQARLEVPEAAVGPCHVRVLIERDGQVAIGAADVEVRKATQP